MCQYTIKQRRVPTRNSLFYTARQTRQVYKNSAIKKGYWSKLKKNVLFKALVLLTSPFIHHLQNHRNVKWKFSFWNVYMKTGIEHKLFHFLSGIGTLCTFTTTANPFRCRVVGALGSFSSCFIINARLISTAPHRAALPSIQVSTVMTQIHDPSW